MADAIVLRQVTKTFGEKTAVRDLDLVVPQGALYGIIGPNGAGKTTTIRIMLSILFADRGEVQVLGQRSALDAKDRIGYLPEERGLYKKMKVGDFLLYMARLKGCTGAGLERRMRQGLERVDLGGVERKRCEELSKGMQQKLQFLAAILHEPDLLVFDEPFSGLDPLNMRLLRDLVREQHERGATILFSTHVMTQAEQLCQHIVMIHDGAKVLDDDLEAIRNAHAVRSLWFEPLDPQADVAQLERLGCIAGVEREGAVWTLELADHSTPEAAMRAVLDLLPAARLEIRRPSLEDIFVGIVTRGRAASEETARLRAALRDNGAAIQGAHR